ncbi:hypothetical protein [Spongiactinospora sp. 9N601]|uniref:nSTAND1 domain-containing NTPase n=1 Tax=Spongiactinospora sp. 9N601 TaxID=3375149 RepID=UPI0037A08060
MAAQAMGMEEEGGERRAVARRRAQGGIRNWARQVGHGAARVAPRALLLGMCASALAPLAVAGEELLIVSTGILGSVGANLLSDMLGSALQAARERSGQVTPPMFVVEGELAAGLEAALRTGDRRAEEVTGQLARVLTEVDAARVVLEEAVRAGDAHLAERLALGFAELGGAVGGFAPLLDQLGLAAEEIQRTLGRQDAEHRHDRHRIDQQLMLLGLLREQVQALHDRLEPPVTGEGRSLPGGGEAPWLAGCPYQGLLPFGPEHATVFHGRGQATVRLAAMLAARVHDPGLVLLTGASGAGKSSLLRAGLLPGLPRGLLPGVPAARHWPYLVFTPAVRPLRELAVQLAVRCGAEPGRVWEQLARDPWSAAEHARDVLVADAVRRAEQGAPPAPDPRRLLVVVDQFEEAFSRPIGEEAENGEEQAQFVAALQAIATLPVSRGGDPAGVVLVAVRGDYVDRCAIHPELAQALEERAHVLGPMSPQELHRAITGPAAAARVPLEAGLAEQILAELAGRERHRLEVGALPLLSQAMVRTWDNREAGRMTRRGYDLAGGIASAVEATAEDAYAGLTPSERHAARTLLLRLTATQEDGQHVRRRIPREEAIHGLAPGRVRDTEKVLEVFTGQRLVVVGDRTMELAHDVLVAGWPRLRGWLEEGQADRVLYGQVVEDAAEWQANGRDPAYLYKGTRLALAQKAGLVWREAPQHFAPLPAAAAEFLQAGARAEARAGRRRRWTAASLVVLSIVALSAAGAAIMNASAAESRRQETLSRLLSARGDLLRGQDPILSGLLAAEGWRHAHTDEARYSMIAALTTPANRVLNGHTDGFSAITFSPDGAMVATGGFDGTVRLFDTASGRPQGTLTGHAGGAWPVVFSPDGTRLATGDGDGERDGVVRIWDVATRRRVAGPLTGHRGDLHALAFNADGTRLTSVDQHQGSRIWDTRTWRAIDRRAGGLRTGIDPAAVLSPDGKTLAVGIGTTGTLGTWQLWDHRHRRALGPPLEVEGVVFNRRGTRLLTWKDDYEHGQGIIRVHDVATRRPIGGALKLPGDVASVAFAPDGRAFAVGGSDGSIRMFDLRTHAPSGAILRGHTGGVADMAFSADGRHLVSNSDDNTARIWDIGQWRQISRTVLPKSVGGRIATLSRDGKSLAVAEHQLYDDAGRLPTVQRVFDIATGRLKNRPFRLDDLGGVPNAAAISSDGRYLALAAFVYNATQRSDGDGLEVIDLWDRKVVDDLHDRENAFTSAAFSPDGRTLAAGGSALTLWESATMRRIATVTGSAGHDVLTFGADGKTLLTVEHNSADVGTIHAWDARTWRRTGNPFAHPGHVSAAALSSAGDYLATSDDNGVIRLWDTATRREIPTPLTNDESEPPVALAFSADTTTLTSTTRDGITQTWRLRPPHDPYTEICALAGRSLTAQEHAQYIPAGEAFTATCS